IRKYIIPALAEETFSVYEHSRSISEQLSEDEAFFNLQVDQLMNEVSEIKGVFKVSRSFINSLPKSLSRRLIKRILQQFMIKDIQTVHIEEVLSVMQSSKPNLSVTLPNQICCVIAYDIVQFSTMLDEIEPYEMILDVDSTLVLPQGSTLCIRENKVDEKTEKSCINKVDLCYNEIELPLKVRTRKPGDRITLMNGHGTKKIKEIMIECRVPKHLRDTWPIITDSNDRIIWIPLLKKSSYCQQHLNGKTITIDYCHLGGNEEDA
ncbi:tRNA lysidine(34) synthetase TilS, partial [Eggerthella lenta]|nr:tRNA lysidine(34) synthetase TilS [Eggerthella lenta]